MNPEEQIEALTMNTPTPPPLTDAEIEDWVNGLQHMSDDHLCCRATVLDTIELIKELRSGRDKLRNVSDELALAIHTGNEHGYGLRIGDRAIELYDQLPHVIERKTIKTKENWLSVLKLLDENL